MEVSFLYLAYFKCAVGSISFRFVVLSDAGKALKLFAEKVNLFIVDRVIVKRQWYPRLRFNILRHLRAVIYKI